LDIGKGAKRGSDVASKGIELKDMFSEGVDIDVGGIVKD
jgi:hypothetical protein